MYFCTKICFFCYNSVAETCHYQVRLWHNYFKEPSITLSDDDSHQTFVSEQENYNAAAPRSPPYRSIRAHMLQRLRFQHNVLLRFTWNLMSFILQTQTLSTTKNSDCAEISGIKHNTVLSYTHYILLFWKYTNKMSALLGHPIVIRLTKVLTLDKITNTANTFYMLLTWTENCRIYNEL